MNFFDVNSIAFTILGYPMSYLEFVGTIFYLLSVLLIAWRNMWTWIIGIISVLLFMILFYQIQLYADTIEQVYYLFASAYGWWYWRSTKQNQDAKTGEEIKVAYGSQRNILTGLGIIIIGSILMGIFVSRAHELLPFFFTVPADYPYLDALTTVMSFVAMGLMARKQIESWIYWIIVDVIGIGLYFVKDVRFISLLYVVLLLMALNGFWVWHRSWAKSQNTALLLKQSS